MSILNKKTKSYKYRNFCKHIYLKLISKRQNFNALSYRRKHNWVLFNWEYAISYLYSILINSSLNITQVRVHHITSRLFLFWRLQDIFCWGNLIKYINFLSQNHIYLALKTSFNVSAVILWNELPESLRNCTTLKSFKSAYLLNYFNS